LITPWQSPLPLSSASAVGVVRTLQDAGHAAFLVGGAVRDILLDREPGDWDVATEATPAHLLELFPQAILVGASFGVVIVPDDGRGVETATFRRDGCYLDGRHPEDVEFTNDAGEDALRRDFTINALYLDPVAGILFDPVGGGQDAQTGLLRTVGEPLARFSEDGLRLLRAARFMAELGFSVEEGTRRGMREAAAMIDSIAAERVGDELVRILQARKPSLGLELLRSTGILERFLPEVADLHGVEQSPDHHPEGSVWTHTMAMLDLAESPSPALAAGILLHDVGKPQVRVVEQGSIRFPGHSRRSRDMAVGILSRLRRSAGMTQTVGRLVDRHMQFLDTPGMRPSTLKRFLAQDNFDDLLELHRLDRLSGSGNLSIWEFCRSRLAAWTPEELRPTPLLTGREIMRLGYPRGPLIGVILEAQQTAQLEGEIASIDEAKTWIARCFPR